MTLTQRTWLAWYDTGSFQLPAQSPVTRTLQQHFTHQHKQTLTALTIITSSGRLCHILTGGRRTLQRRFEEGFKDKKAT